MNSTELATGNKVEWTEESYGTVEKRIGVVVYVVGDSAYVLIGTCARMMRASSLTKVRGTAAPFRGRGREALNSAIWAFPEGHKVRQVAECLLFQATGGNCKIGNAALAIVNDGTALKVWNLIAGILAKVDDASQWGDVRRAADEVAA